MRAHHRTALATVTAAALTGGLLGLTAGGVNTSTRAQAFAQHSAGVPGGDVKLDAVAGGGRGGATPVKLALAGAAMHAFLAALVSGLATTHARALAEFRFGQVGSLSGRGTEVIGQI
ncbi:iron ABC transporter permease, partial [Streptomyces griseoluteus]